jgi:hypothetical protein
MQSVEAKRSPRMSLPPLQAEVPAMNAAIPIRSREPRENLFCAADIEDILRERGWIEAGAQSEPLTAWIGRAAFLLGRHAGDRAALAELLGLVFHYDAPTILRSPVSHTVLGREGARDVIRELALAVLESPAVDSDRFKVIISGIKSRVPYTGHELFYPVRLALAGRVGGGELDRVILLLDDVAAARGLAPV